MQDTFPTCSENAFDEATGYEKKMNIDEWILGREKHNLTHIQNFANRKVVTPFLILNNGF